jgi:carbon monoxide dehydrogenase subunit G
VIIDQRIAIAAPVERVWDHLMDVPAVGRCVPGVETVVAGADGTYTGVLHVKVGPISARLEGKLVMAERDRESWQARMDVQASDRRLGGSVNAKMTMRLAPLPDGGTEMAVHTDAAVLGKLGQFGQAIIKRQADQLMAEFAKNLSREVEAAGAEPAG